MERVVFCRRRLLTLVGAGLLLPGAARADALPKDYENLKARIDQEARLTTPVWIEGQGPFLFVVDTGSNHSIIAQDLADTLGLKSTGRVLVNTVAGAEETPAVQAASFGVGRPDGRATVMGVAPASAIGGVGLLGIDQLDNLRLTLNFRAKRLAVSRSGRRRADDGSLAVPALQKSGQLTLVGAQVGGLPVTAFVDSGSQVTIGNLALRQAIGPQLKPLRDPGAPASVPVIGATGLEMAGATGFLPPLKLGGMTINKLAVIFADLHTFHVWGMAEEPALLIGVDLLRRFETVDLDFGRSEVLFKVPGYAPAITGTRLPGGSLDSVHTVRHGG
ncbi:MAG: aspartyl protease family protein [Ignavibacteriales bacterium]